MLGIVANGNAILAEISRLAEVWILMMMVMLFLLLLLMSMAKGVIVVVVADIIALAVAVTAVERVLDDGGRGQRC